jgi:hypothetical protein
MPAIPRWAPRLESRLYRPIAYAAAHLLGRLPWVRSVSARRSLACDEIVFGASDIDLHLVVDEARDLADEAQRLATLAVATARIKRVLLPLGQYDVTTLPELMAWYTARPYTYYRDRAWLHLFGEPAARPPCALRDQAARDSLLWWLFQAFELLPGSYRAGDVRTCSNVFLDVVNAAAVYTGEIGEPAPRREVLAHWWAAADETEAPRIAAAVRHAYRGRFGALRAVIYAETLRALDALARRVDRTLAGPPLPAELRSADVFRGRDVRYLLVDPADGAALAAALAALERDPQIVVTTDAALRLQLLHRNPWEGAALAARNTALRLEAVDDEHQRRAVRLLAHRLVARRAGLSIGRQHDYGLSAGRHLAQARLYLEHGFVAVDATELEASYARHYGRWPLSRPRSAPQFFRDDYPELCAIIARLAQAG